MNHYYISTRPQTVVSVVQNGALPKRLPRYCQQDTLLCCKEISKCIAACNTPLDQTFIACVKGAIKEASLHAKKIDPNSIQLIFVASAKAHKLITRLFQGKCPKPIEVMPELFPAKKRKQESLTVPKAKRVKLTAPLTQSKRLFWGLRTIEAHIQFLQSAFRRAKKTILLTTYNLNYDTLERANLYRLIPEAAKRGVTIYLYYSDEYELEDDVADFFDEWGVRHSASYTHSKILAVDRNLVAIGSFNWLGGINKRFGSSDNASIVTEGPICNALLDDIWLHLKHYRHMQFENDWQLNEFEDNPDNSAAIIYPFKNGSSLTYLPTLEHHRSYFIDLFKRAKKRLIICAPFVSPQFLEDIDDRDIIDATKRGIKIYFVFQKNTLDKELEQALSPFQGVHLIKLNKIHLKTTILDDLEITEGSFNWMSATRDSSSEFHHHEATLVAKGKDAKPLIRGFFRSRIGRNIPKS